ncbi:MAG: efflux RND transporter periplasmic adaptor subunit [Xanthomonadales bacterium]|nr:efflux RND transporter periplasmic adaptor subunit [Gammaproteobacteria bacterium]MBT8051881.1 efflux RND transporter periplasmic adaptor subunit [Gammaproteobacteria bacterium]MBT8056493.1 efflux RND transporter periplasmic adaptor subunit [Gammaproteobacteria bacterium]NNJ80449.1 efflux RND transporter periplasmic adaptor subunit [Xanthomonadales bacterium]NNL04819.1 efflux RND transporter periplasmic adaptor subunit [Xanthomonadales bacterium]
MLVLLAGFMVVQGLVAAKPQPEKKDEEVRKLSLYVDSVVSEEVTVAIRTQGAVRPKTEIELIPQVSGRIVMVSDQFSAGAEFAPNTLLAKIDDADYQVAAVRAEARVAEAQTALERELATAEIKKEEWRDGGKNQEPTDFALNLTQVRQAQAMLRAAKADLEKARLDLARTEIRVPFQGRVRTRGVGLGQIVSAGASMGRVFSIDTVEVRLPLTDAQLTELNLPLGFEASEEAGAPAVSFSAMMGSREYHWRGNIVRIDASIDESTRLIYATAEVRDPYGEAAKDGMPIAVGMFVNAEIKGVREQKAFVMPRLALRNKNSVYVINEENELEIRTVDVLSTSEERVLVKSGVLPGDRVVTSPVPNAIDGMAVEPLFRKAQG